MREVHVGFSFFATEAQRLAALPLFEAGVIDALEHTVDVGWSAPLPEWAQALLEHYGAAGRLYGHGVSLSPCSAEADDAATRWLEQVARDPWRYRHLTEHWGFSRARGLVRSAPMPLPACAAAVATTTRALRALADVARVPVGLENLALAMSAADVDAQPAMLGRVLDEVDGVLLLDLHNLWCQAVNYARDPQALALRYPLARVRQLHLAGGSWSDSAFGAPFRRDTHDGAIPDEVLALAARLIPRCPALEVVIVERLPTAIGDADAWRAEWTRVAELVRRAAREPLVATPAPPRVELDDTASIDALGRFQDAMTQTLVDGRRVRATLLEHPACAPFRDQVAAWDLRAVEVAIALTAKWGVLAG